MLKRAFPDTPLINHLLMVGFLASACLLRWVAPQVLGHTPYLAFYPVVVASAAVGGLWPGLLSTILSTLLVELLVVHWAEPPSVQAGRVGIFLAGGIGISIVCQLNRNAQRQSSARARQIQDSEREFRAFFDNVAVGAVEMDEHMALTRVNDRFCQITGYSREELLGRTAVHIIHPEDAAADLQRARQFRAGILPIYESEKRYIRKDGEIVWVHVFVAPIKPEPGVPGRTAAIIQEITERKLAEEASHRAKTKAEEASKAKDHFLAVLSHELRTPLTPVTTALAMLEHDARLPDDVREELSIIQRNVELETRLIDDLLDLTRVARGKVTLDRRPLVLYSVLEHVAAICAADLEARGIHFHLDLQDRTAVVDGDSARIQQVFWNILKNAIKFTPRGGCIGMKLWKVDGHAVAEISDSGRGIEPALLPRIFDAFEQGGPQVTKQFGGLGLGLAICRALVDLHGGTLRAHSEGIGHGTVFTVCLPLSQQRAASSGENQPNRDAQTPNHGSLRLLLVEDHRDTARIMKRFLGNCGHEVSVAVDVASGLSAVREAEFDLIVSDLGLPDGSGLDLIRQIRSEGRNVPAIALSGYGQEEDLRRSREAGFSEHLVKPVDVRRIQETIERVVKTCGGAVSAPPAPAVS